jgi:hypothetical protein
MSSLHKVMQVHKQNEKMNNYNRLIILHHHYELEYFVQLLLDNSLVLKILYFLHELFVIHLRKRVIYLIIYILPFLTAIGDDIVRFSFEPVFSIIGALIDVDE